ncbi:hypothetical protein [Janthinobacterium sp.]|uniref:hypothetical protein n=1 Tax=Janthinobacterium sp. TaxID=1871054 RepID=UPI00293D4D11|nr:hypothetical protein [Janthinobacterium sp.]
MLDDVVDSIPYLQVFAARWRTGQIAPLGEPVRSRTVENALRAIGQTMASVGAEDRRLNTRGNIEYRLQQQLKGYKRIDPPPDRVKPIPFQLVNQVNLVANLCNDPMSLAAADLATLGFFFLLRPGEHTHPPTTAANQPFRLMDVTFRYGNQNLPADTANIDQLTFATFATLTFTTQKNAVRNEIVGHARSGHSTTCPVAALIRRTLHLRAHNASPTTTLCTVYALSSTSTTYVTSTILTATLRSALAALPDLGILPRHISARALRAGGAMALLCGQVDSNIIKLVGRWRSDEMLRYLHLQAYPLMMHLAPSMVRGGQFHMLSHQPLPPAVLPLLFAAAEADQQPTL